MSALFFLATMILVVWLGVWAFEQPSDAAQSQRPRSAPFDYADIGQPATPAPPVAQPTSAQPRNVPASGARWRQRRDRLKRKA